MQKKTPRVFFSPKVKSPEGHISYHKEDKTMGNSIGFPFHLKEKRSCFFFFFFGWWKRLNKSRKKGEPQLICKCKGVWKRVFRLSSGSAQQLGGGSRAGSGSLWDVLLLVGVLEALGKSCFFFVFSFGKKVGGGTFCRHLAPCMVWELRFLS